MSRWAILTLNSPLGNESIAIEADRYSPSEIDPSHTAVRLDAERVVSAVQIADLTVDRRKPGSYRLEGNRQLASLHL